ncbi:MAG: gamma-glutamyl-gamma-aminobutyrate hydrolase family protein [Chloroflexi bacterium]|nr:gamma-glutamyl-gamma-aminobutyrate hydrolase family protein [Chloroflexota bacterium]
MVGKARIGITTSLTDGRQSLDTHYAQAVEAAGGIPIIVPLLRSAAAAQSVAGLLDGLIISGGPGITRGLIGALPDDLSPVDPLRDTSDELALRAMGDRPVLGICYGMQFVNALAGGAIFGDAQAQATAKAHSPERGAGEHSIQIEANSRLHDLVGAGQITTNSDHIQAIASLGAGLRATAQAEDGVIEALESDDGRVVGVQFHPERMGKRGLPLFTDLVRRARASR